MNPMTFISDYLEMLKLENLYEYLAYKSNQHADCFAAQEYRDGRIFTHTYTELLNDVRTFGNYLIENDIYRKHISIIGGFSYEWLVSLFSVLYSNNVVVPIDGGQSSERISVLLRAAEAEVIITRNKSLSLEQGIAPNVKSIIYFEDLNRIIASGAPGNVQKAFNAPAPESPAMIVFTSGTTGASKGVLLSHKNILHAVIGSVTCLGENAFSPGDTTIELLPLFHLYGITAGIFDVFYYGISLCYSKNTIKDIEILMKTFKPSVLIAVPQIVEGLHKKIWAMAKKAGKQDILKIALRFNSVLRKVKIDLRRILFNNILKSFGGNLTAIICGGAAVSEKVVKEMDEFGIDVLVGYGLTECSPIVSINPPKKKKLGSVGVPLPEPLCSVKIKDGEIMVSGSIVMDGYYKDPEGTSDAFDEGKWLKTGDTGRFDADGYLYITGRKKDLIILSDGNNISPEELETRIRQSPVVDSVMVYAEKRKQTPVLCALIYPDFQYCAAENISDINGETAKLIRRINNENPGYMKIFDFKISELPFEETAVGKIKRGNII